MSHTPERVLVGSLQKFSVEDGPGIRTTVFLKGCPLHCGWCHNPELIEEGQQLIRSPNNCIGCGWCVKACPRKAIRFQPDTGVTIDRNQCDLCLKCAEQCYAEALRPVAKWMTRDEILDIAEQDKGFYEKTGGGITVSGGELLLHAPFVAGLIDGAGERGMQVCLDTSGCGSSQALLGLAKKKNVTTILYDMKAIDDRVHRAYTGVSNVNILSNLRMLAADQDTAGKLILRMPLIGSVNDGGEIIRRTGDFYRENGIRRVNLLPYHNLGISKQRNLGGLQKEFQPPKEERLTEIEAYFRDEIHMEVEILGRV